MIHIKAIVIGACILFLMLGIMLAVAKYPIVGVVMLALVTAYCFGRAAQAMLVRRIR